MADEPAWVRPVADAAAIRVGMAEPVRFPEVLIDYCAGDVEALALDAARLPRSEILEADPEFGILGSDMVDYFDSYGFDEWMPGAWPLALDGGGGFFCLDLRDVAAGRAANDGSAAVVWSHAGNLGWARRVPPHGLGSAELPGIRRRDAAPARRIVTGPYLSFGFAGYPRG